MAKGNKFLWKKEKNYYKDMNFVRKGKCILKERESVWVFRESKIWYSGFLGAKRDLFQHANFVESRSLDDILRDEKVIFQFSVNK